MPSQPTIAAKVEAAERAYQQAAAHIARSETLFRDGAEITNLYAEQEDPIIRASLLADAVQKFAASAALQSQIVNQLKIAARAMAAANSARAAGAESIAMSVERERQRVAKLESEAQRLKAVTAATNKSQKTRRQHLAETSRKLAEAQSRLGVKEADAKLVLPAEPQRSDVKVYGPYREASGRYQLITVIDGKRTKKNYMTLEEAERARAGLLLGN